jgi:hypothetical protein
MRKTWGKAVKMKSNTQRRKKAGNFEEILCKEKKLKTISNVPKLKNSMFLIINNTNTCT